MSRRSRDELKLDGISYKVNREWQLATFKSEFNANDEAVGIIQGCIKLFGERNYMKICGLRDNGTQKTINGLMRPGSDCDAWREKNEFV